MLGYGHALWIWNWFLFMLRSFQGCDFITTHFPIQSAQCGCTGLFSIASSKMAFQLLMPLTLAAVILFEFSSRFYSYLFILNGSSWHCYGPRQMPPLQNIYCEAQVFLLLPSASVFSGPSKLEERKSFWSWWFQHKLPAYFHLWVVPLKSHICRMKASLAPRPDLLQESIPVWLGTAISSSSPKIL